MLDQQFPNRLEISYRLVGINQPYTKYYIKSRIEGMTVMGENVSIGDEIFINGCIIMPHKNVSCSEFTTGKVIM